MNRIPYREQQFHPIRWIGKMAGHISDDFYKKDSEMAKLILDYGKQNPDSPNPSKPVKEMLKEINYTYATLEGFEINLDVLFSFVWHFFEKGQNIFQIRQELIEMLMRTDVNNVHINDIKLPFDMFYLYFGNTGPKLWDDYRLDGVYIEDLSASEDEPEIGLNFIGSKFPNTYPPGTDSTIVFEYEINLFTSLNDVWGETMADNFNWRSSEDRRTTDFKTEIESLWEPYIDDIFSLVINAILFINHCPEDLEETYSENTPRGLVEKVQKAKQRNDKETAKRTASKISSRGFKKIKLVGSKAAKKINLSRDHNSPRSHWRRGHWRRQKVGKNLSEEKLIWIAPTLVAGDGKTHPEIKHLYDVENRNDNQ